MLGTGHQRRRAVIPPFSRSRRDTIRRRLLEWYDRSRRDLPWRRTKDPYRIWLSESMLQQTRVETAIPYYERFLTRFPTLRALAVADEQDVLLEWAGLGYYARARNLKRAAEQVLREHGGRVPRDADLLAALPGIGPYTSGAIRSIAFDEPAPIVDANARRVIARLLAEPALSESDTWAKAQELVPRRDPGRFNQALMELGAMVCTARTPTCPTCPVRRSCRAARLGDPERYPAPKAKKPPRELALVSGFVRRGPKLLMLRRASAGLLGGLWEIPTEAGKSVAPLTEALLGRTGLRTCPGKWLGGVRHQLSHRLLDVRVLELELVGGRLRRTARGEARWCGPSELAKLPLSTLMRKILPLVPRIRV